MINTKRVKINKFKLNTLHYFDIFLKNVIFNIYSFIEFKERYKLIGVSRKFKNYFNEYPHNEKVKIDYKNYKIIEKYKSIKFKCTIYPRMTAKINLYNYRNLYKLDLRCCKWITNLSFLRNQDINRIHTLILFGCSNIVDVSMLGHYKKLDLSFCYNIKDVSKLGNVDTLILRSCYSLQDVSMLHNVRILNLSFCNNLKKFSNNDNKIWTCEELYLSYTNITNVSLFKNIKKLYLSSCLNVNDISMLGNLEKLVILYCKNIPPHQIIKLKNKIKVLNYIL